MSKVEDEIHQMWSWMRDEGNAGPQNMLQAILSGIKGNNPPDRNNFHWVGEVVTSVVSAATAQILKAIQSGVQVDEADVREALNSIATDAVAKAVNDERDRRERERLDVDSDEATGVTGG